MRGREARVRGAAGLGVLVVGQQGRLWWCSSQPCACVDISCTEGRRTTGAGQVVRWAEIGLVQGVFFSSSTLFCILVKKKREKKEKEKKERKKEFWGKEKR